MCHFYTYKVEPCIGCLIVHMDGVGGIRVYVTGDVTGFEV